MEAEQALNDPLPLALAMPNISLHLLPDLWQLVARYLDSHTAKLLSQLPGLESILCQSWLLLENVTRMHKQASTLIPGPKAIPEDLIADLTEPDREVLNHFYPFLFCWNRLLFSTGVPTMDPELYNWTLLVDMARDWLSTPALSDRSGVLGQGRGSNRVRQILDRLYTRLELLPSSRSGV